MNEFLPDVHEGDQPSAAEENIVRRAIRAGYGACGGFYADSAGLVPYPSPAQAAASGLKYGKVDGTGPWTSSTATVSVWANGEDTGDDLTVSMPPWITSWSVASGTWVELKQYAGDTTWYATPMVSQVVETTVQIDTSSKKLQKKTRTLVGPFVDAESAWTDVYTFVSVTPLTAFQVDGANKKLQDKTKQFYVVEPQTESGWTDIHTGELGVCP